LKLRREIGFGFDVSLGIDIPVPILFGPAFAVRLDD